MRKRSLVSLEVVNFRREIQRIKDEVKFLANAEIDDLVDYAVEQLRIVTPVDTGKARSGWYMDNRKDIYGYSGAVIVNDVDYISYLNRGSSQQAPQFFIEQVLLTIGIITRN